MEEGSPFIYGKTVSLNAFTNREDEISKLEQNLTGGINTIIISPRRWGKSSLVEKMAADLKRRDKNIRIAVMDMFSVSTEKEFMELFAREVVKASSTRWQEWVNNAKTFFKFIKPTIQITTSPSVQFNISFDWKEIEKHGNEILNLPETIATEKKIHYIVCIDEFQNLASVPGFAGFEKKLRAVWQRQKSVTYCLYGSKRHMMAGIFNNPSKPFYRFGDIMVLPKIERSKWVKFLCRKFKNTGKLISTEVAGMIPDLMQNHSWYVQQLSHYTWNLTHGQAGKTEIRQALHELIRANMPLYERETEIMSGTQLNLLKAVAAGESQLTSAKVMAEYSLGTPRNVAKNRDLLIARDMIQTSGNQYEFVDPAFELWFRERFLGQPCDTQLGSMK